MAKFIDKSIDEISNNIINYNEIVTDETKKEYFWFYFIKRMMDIFCSFIGLVFLSPLFLVVSILIKAESKGPVFYVQKRVGINGKEFKIYKFRSMCDDADKQLESLAHLNEREGPAFKLTNDPRITKIGEFLRKSCIDELPQLFNVLRSDMSIVGPRPPLTTEVEQYTPYQKRRLEAKPGLTCYWQISDREVTFNEWVKMDLKYIKEKSIISDIKIIFKTFISLFKSVGDK